MPAKNSLRQFRALGLIAAVGGLGCGQTGTETDNPFGGHDHPAGVQVVRSSKAYLNGVTSPATDMDALRSGTRAFALDLYRQAAARAGAEDNLLLGAQSVTSVLAMTSAGARGVTEDELAAVMRHGLSQAALHPAMNQLSRDLQASLAGTTAKYQPLPSIWLGKDAQVDTGFLDILAEDYDAGVFLADFAGNSESARSSINDWVAKQTQGLIPELLDAGTIDPTTELILTNAAYLSAPWRDRLNPQLTTTGEFSLPDGSAVDVPMMGGDRSCAFAFDVAWRAFELPFTAPSLSMVFVLPNADEFTELESSFDAATIERIIAGLDEVRTDPHLLAMSLPRFDFSSSIDLASPLQGLGVRTAFEQASADFSGIEPNRQLFVNRLVHRTTIAVDENGTTAAASAGNLMDVKGLAPQISLNRPFLFFIYDRGSGSVLFVGRYLRPPGDAHAPAQPKVVPTDAEAICSTLATCQGRTTTATECQSALSADSTDVVRRCADCIRLGTDECGSDRRSSCAWSHGDICEPATCAAHCPSHAF